MILEHIILDNVRSHKRTELVFERGTTLLSGDMGSGKSSILMAIEFALFGLGPYRAEALLSRRANDGYVELRFSVDGKRYEIKRTLKKTEAGTAQDAKGSYLAVDGEKQTLSTGEMKQRVMKILRFNEPSKGRAISHIFRYAVFTPQEEMKAVLSDPDRRLSTVRRAFGIEDYKTAADNAKIVATDITRRASKFEGLAAGAEDLKESVRARKERLKGAEERLKGAREESDRRAQELESAKAEREALAGQESEKAALEQKIAAADAAMAEKTRMRDSLSSEIAKDEAEERAASEEIRGHRVPQKPTEMKMDEIESEIWERAEAEKSLADSRARYKSLSDDIGQIDSEMGGRAGADPSDLEDEAGEAETGAGEARKRQKDAEQRALKAEYAAKQCAKEISRMDEAAGEALQEGAKCPTCQNVITGEHLRRLEEERGRERARLEAEAVRAGQDRGRASDEAEKARAEAESREKALGSAKRLADLATSRSKKAAEREVHTARIAGLEKSGPAEQMREMRARLLEYQAAVSASDMLKKRLDSAQKDAQRHRSSLASVEGEIAAAEAARKEAAAGLDRFAGLDEKASAADARLSEKQEQATQARTRLASHERDVENDRSSLSDDEARLAEAVKWAKERDRYVDYARWVSDFFAAAMPEIEKRVMREVWADFNEAYRAWYARLVDDYTKESGLDEEFAPYVRQDGFEHEVAHMSGGEKTSVALAYRLALNTVLRKKADILKSSLLILDEPTDGFSAGQMEKIKEILDELESEQIIMVSHDHNLVGYADHVVRVLKDGDHTRTELIRR